MNRVSVVGGIAVFVLIALVGLVIVGIRPSRWSARASVVVLPEPDADPVAVASFYESLSSGQIIATFAEVVQLQRFEADAARSLGLSEAQRRDIEVLVEVIPETALFTVTATSASPEQSERMADAVLTAANANLQALASPFNAVVVAGAGGTATQTGLAPLPFLGIVLACGGVAGAAAQQGLRQLLEALPPQPRAARAARDEPPGKDRDQPATPLPDSLVGSSPPEDGRPQPLLDEEAQAKQ